MPLPHIPLVDNASFTIQNTLWDDETMSQTPSDGNNFRMLWLHEKHAELALKTTSPICVDSEEEEEDVFNHGGAMEEE